jgi:hypothetical protein
MYLARAMFRGDLTGTLPLLLQTNAYGNVQCKNEFILKNFVKNTPPPQMKF